MAERRLRPQVPPLLVEGNQPMKPISLQIAWLAASVFAGCACSPTAVAQIPNNYGAYFSQSAGSRGAQSSNRYLYDKYFYQRSTVSPYLNLNRNEEDNEAAPNYFAFVRPQLEQLEANRMQQRAIQQLNGQLQSMSSTVVTPGYQSSAMPGTGTPARYMDTAQFYGGWRR